MLEDLGLSCFFSSYFLIISVLMYSATCSFLLFGSGVLAVAVSSLNAALIDPLDDVSNFGSPLNSVLVSTLAGEVSVISDQASVDRLVDWQLGGTVRLDLINEGMLQVTPGSQIGNGEWGLWVLYYQANGIFNDEVNILDFTDSTSVFTMNVNDTAPVGSDEYVLRFRIREAVGEGFSFTQINATSVPEPRVALLASLALCGLLRRRRN